LSRRTQRSKAKFGAKLIVPPYRVIVRNHSAGRLTNSCGGMKMPGRAEYNGPSAMPTKPMS